MGRKVIDLTGKQFGQLTVIGLANPNTYPKYWKCLCECGNTKTVQGGNLKSGGVKSCGCFLKDPENTNIKAAIAAAKVVNTKHGKYGQRVHNIWSGMLNRCNNQFSKDFPEYGGRGITVSESWLIFENFYNDMGDPPEDCTLDRLDSDLGYCKSNCRWATKKTQARNRRNNRNFELAGETKTLAEWCEIYTVNYETVRARLRRGVPIEKALQKNNPKGFSRHTYFPYVCFFMS